MYGSCQYGEQHSLRSDFKFGVSNIFCTWAEFVNLTVALIGGDCLENAEDDVRIAAAGWDSHIPGTMNAVCTPFPCSICCYSLSLPVTIVCI